MFFDTGTTLWSAACRFRPIAQTHLATPYRGGHPYWPHGYWPGLTNRGRCVDPMVCLKLYADVCRPCRGCIRPRAGPRLCGNTDHTCCARANADRYNDNADDNPTAIRDLRYYFRCSPLTNVVAPVPEPARIVSMRRAHIPRRAERRSGTGGESALVLKRRSMCARRHNGTSATVGACIAIQSAAVLPLCAVINTKNVEYLDILLRDWSF